MEVWRSVRESFSLMEACQSRLTAGEGTGEKTSASLLVSVVPPASEQPTEKGREMLFLFFFFHLPSEVEPV